MMKTDILAIGAHPDDVEIGMGGTLSKAVKSNLSVTIANLTKAELSSNGTVEERLTESAKAAETLGVSAPITYDFPDRGLLSTREKAILTLVKLIRKLQPEYIFAPHFQDRHPDHGHCAEIVREAFFSAGIRKYGELEAYKPKALYYYQINGLQYPEFAIDITENVEEKFEALACFSSQFNASENTVGTPLNNGYLKDLRARNRLLGKDAGVSYAEGFYAEGMLLYPFSMERNRT